MSRVIASAAAFTVLAASVASAQSDTVRLKESRYQIGQMERLLEGAVEHGATIIRDRLQAMMPADMLLSENARARGFRLDNYGVFFDVEVPPLSGTLPWTFMTLNQNNLGADNALRTLRTFVNAANNPEAQQALKRLELQVAAVPAAATMTAESTAGGTATGARPAEVPPVYTSLDDIREAYRTEIRNALIDAMLEHSRGLGLSSSEFLTVAARGSDDRPRLAPADADSRTVVISVRGADLAAFLGGQITREEARARVEIRVF